MEKAEPTSGRSNEKKSVSAGLFASVSGKDGFPTMFEWTDVGRMSVSMRNSVPINTQKEALVSKLPLNLNIDELL
jgi:hypothetical protein